MKSFLSSFTLGALIGAWMLSPAQAAGPEWVKAGEAAALNPTQTKAVEALSTRLGEMTAWGRYYGCYVNQNGKSCRPDEWPNITDKAVAQKWVTDGNACIAAAKAVLDAGVPPTQPIDFESNNTDVSFARDFNNGMAARNGVHLCTVFQWQATQHLGRVESGTPYTGNSPDYKIATAAQVVGDEFSRLVSRSAQYECYLKGSDCEKGLALGNPEYAGNWAKEGERCVSAVQRAHEMKVPANFPIAFTGSYKKLQSPETFAVLEKECLEQAKIAEKHSASVHPAAPSPASAASTVSVIKPAAAEATLSPEQEKLISALQQNSPQTVTAYGAHNNPSSSAKDDLRSLAQFWAQNAKECEDLVAKALSAGVPKDYSFAFHVYESGLKSPMPLAAYSKDVCVKTREQSEKIVNAKASTDNARLEPYYAVLKGDRLRLFKEHSLLNRGVWGPGGVELRTPEDFVKSPAWYTASEDRNSGPQVRWLVGGWQFDGDKVLRPYSSSGFGRNPPSDAFVQVAGGSGGSYSGTGEGGGFFGFVWWLVWTVIRLAVVAFAALVFYRWYGRPVPVIEQLLNRVPQVRTLLMRLPIPVRKS